MSNTKITTTAPGKIILFGEHAVVYKRPALAVPVTQVNAICHIKPAPLDTGIVLIAPDLNEHYQLSELAANHPLGAVVHHVLNLLQLETEPDLRLTVSSTIPIARGLGSGAAISTALVKGLTDYFKHPMTTQNVSDVVFEIEKIHHGTPSGIDNTVVAFAQPIFFIREQPIERFTVGQPLTLVIADTGIKSPTYKVVGDLRQRWEKDKDYYENYFNQIGNLVLSARQAIETGDITTVGECMAKNQAILEEIGISHPTLNKLIEAALAAGALGAKLSGAGWGGNMIALVKANDAPQIAQTLQTAGAVNTIITTVH